MKKQYSSGEAYISVLELIDLHQRIRRSDELSGKSQSSLSIYARCLAHISFISKVVHWILMKNTVSIFLHILKSQHKTLE